MDKPEHIFREIFVKSSLLRSPMVQSSNTKLLQFSLRKSAIKSQQIEKIDFLLHITRPKNAIKNQFYSTRIYIWGSFCILPQNTGAPGIPEAPDIIGALVPVLLYRRSSTVPLYYVSFQTVSVVSALTSYFR